MSVYVAFDGQTGPQIASNTGWGDAGRWIDGLDPQTYGELVHLHEHGWTQQLAALRDQVAAAMRGSPPDKTVAATMKELLDAIPDSAEVATITDGLTREEDDA